MSEAAEGRSRWSAFVVPAVLVGVALAWQALAGFRVSSEAGRAAEMLAWLAYAIAIVLICVRLGRKHALLAGLLALVLMFLAVDLNTRWATTLDVRHGGAYSWSGLRQVAATWFIGPLAGVATGIVTILIARFGRRPGQPQA